MALASLRKRQRREITLDPDILEAVGTEIESFGSEARLQDRKEALRRCLAELSKPNRSLVRLRYFEDRSYEQIAKTANRSIDALYVAFNRMHKALRECIERALEAA